MFAALGNGPILKRRLERIRQSGKATVLNLHRVAPDDGSDYRPLEPSLFEDLLDFVSKEFFVVGLKDLRGEARKPKLALSFDDGYKDFLHNAYPALRRRGLPSNQNIIPGCIESGLPPLNVVAQDFVGKAPSELVRNLSIPGFRSPLDGRLGSRLSSFLKLRPQSEQDAIAADLMPQFNDWAEFAPTPMMTVEEIRSLEGVDIGAHSYYHSSMEFETKDFLERDLEACRTFLADQLDTKMNIYAFPNGSYRAEQIAQVQEHGVKHVLLVGEQFDSSASVHNRFTFDGRSSSEVRFKAAGSRAAA